MAEETKRMVELERARKANEIRVLRERMGKILEAPDATGHMLLVQLGVSLKTASALAAACSEERIRQVVRYALEKSDENPAGLAIKCLQNRHWPG